MRLLQNLSEQYSPLTLSVRNAAELDSALSMPRLSCEVRWSIWSISIN